LKNKVIYLFIKFYLYCANKIQTATLLTLHVKYKCVYGNPSGAYQTSVEHLSELNALLGTVSKLLSVNQKRGASLSNVCIIIFGTCEN